MYLIGLWPIPTLSHNQVHIPELPRPIIKHSKASKGATQPIKCFTKESKGISQPISKAEEGNPDDTSHDVTS